MNRKIWKALGIAVCMLALAAPRAMAETNIHTVTADTDFAKVVKSINASKDEGEHVIELYNDITLTDNYTLTNGKTTTIKGENHRIFIKGSNAGITVTGEKTTLNLGANGYDGTLTIDGDTGVAFITVSGGATANMYGNVTLQNRGFAGNACVVIKGLKLVTGPDSAFNMYGGVIENCSRAVIAYSGATFYMQSGEIKNCKVDGDGVISVTDNSKFIMEGGTISGCTAVIGNGGGLYAKNSLNVVLVSGEYKIGKTALLQEFLQKKSAAYFAARNALSTVNLAAFCLELKEQGLWGPKNEFRSWDSVLSTLFFKATQQRLVLVIDDVQYLFDSAPEFFTAFAKYAQKYKKQLRLSVIFSGAPFAEMERVLLKNQEMQIKNYINAVIKLGAMDYWEAQPFLEGFTEEEKLFLYGAAGGNPHYMSYLDAELSFKDNLKKLFFPYSYQQYILALLNL